MAGWTNKGKAHALGSLFIPGTYTPPLTFYAALIGDSTPPDVDTNTINASGLAEASGGSYAQQTVALGTAALTEDDTGDLGKLVLANVAWTAIATSITAAANIRYMILLSNMDAAGTGVAGASNLRAIWAWWDLGAIAAIAATQTLTINAPELRLTE